MCKHMYIYLFKHLDKSNLNKLVCITNFSHILARRIKYLRENLKVGNLIYDLMEKSVMNMWLFVLLQIFVCFVSVL